MATYKVQPNQNIFDISLQLYGTIEGVFDLLITNTWLDMDTDLITGQELEYHEDFVLNSSIVSSLSDDGIVPANGERRVYYKKPIGELIAVCDVDASLSMASFIAGGEGMLAVDWGDNSELSCIQLSHTNQTVSHYFDSEVEKRRRIKLYGIPDSTKFTYLDITRLGGPLKTTRTMTVDEFISNSNGWSLTGLFLFDNTYKVNLQQCTISSLLPIGDMYLQELNLTEVRFTNISVLDEYLTYIVQNHGTRNGCTVYLDTEPSEVGMQAIDTILTELEWNIPTVWKFVINGNEMIGCDTIYECSDGLAYECSGERLYAVKKEKNTNNKN